MTTYDPLTASDLSLLKELSTGDIELSQEAMLFSERGQGLSFLCQSGYAKQQLKHVSRDASKSTVVITRTDKPAPAS